jgi:hypothetical protein
MHFRFAPWDLRSLGVPVVEILEIRGEDPTELVTLLAGFDAQMVAEGVGLATLRTSADRLALAEALHGAGFHRVETSHPLRLALSTAHSSLLRRTVEVERATAADSDELSAMARDAFEFSRYHEDRRIHPARARARYYHWIADSLVNGDEVLIHRDRGRLVALMSYRLRGEVATLLLGGVRPEAGPIAAMFWAGVLGHLRERGVHVVDTRVSAANAAALRLHLAMGFVAGGTDLGFTKIYPGGALVGAAP